VSAGAFDLGDAPEDVVEEDDFLPVSLSQIDILQDASRRTGLTNWWLVSKLAEVPMMIEK
jgi:hypothetical protein